MIPTWAKPVRGLATVLASLLVLTCGARLEPSQGTSGDATQGIVPRSPIVVITLSGLRPDVVGVLGASPSIWTPHIDTFASEADWVGTAITASSAPAVALVSMMTGVSPWRHQVLTHVPTPPRPGIRLLAEALREAGYLTMARVPSEYDLNDYGLLRGFSEVAEVEPIHEAVAALKRTDSKTPTFHWFHLREANEAFRRRDGELPRLAPRAARFPQDLPYRFPAWRLLTYADPGMPLPAEEREIAWELFCHEVAWADRQVGMILEALRSSGRWESSWVILTASQGMELGEHSQMLYAQNLGRKSIEVPLMIRLPRSLRGALAVPDDVRVSQLRLWATLVESGGGRLQPSHAPSLFRDTTPPILSELYARDGTNEFSLLDGDLQLLMSTRFAPAEPEFYFAQLAARGGKPPLSEPAHRILDRLELAFNDVLPISGQNADSPPGLRLERWTGTGVEAVEDHALARSRATLLRQRWMRHVDRERTPREESSLTGASR